ncbi:MAG: 1-(5-phosphoribosyl)-5-[(5-phosphoribosylamino)methylideneamino]imidazole-4-carboxamide isomerase [Firmicutes bacterium]|nr:1-(5-phosphoribosyl)-5-[(5-phosphoribosylamino)methylideneamino]imidazole-4-carboxamide isomerase [Bacillota bacterium]
MIIFPAIDISSGRAVRLLHGDFEKKTVYGSPAETAKKFAEAGARHLHVVDLDGARDGGTPNFALISEIIKSTPLSVEVGGGIRTESELEKYIAAGAERVIIGTAAIENREFLKNAVGQHGDKIAVGADFRDGKIATRGWLFDTDTTLEDFLYDMESLGVGTAIVTDISRDGALSGVSAELYSELTQKLHIKIIASGGVSSLENVILLKKAGVFGAIVGRALYTGAVDLASALRAAEEH